MSLLKKDEEKVILELRLKGKLKPEISLLTLEGMKDEEILKLLDGARKKLLKEMEVKKALEGKK